MKTKSQREDRKKSIRKKMTKLDSDNKNQLITFAIFGAIILIVIAVWMLISS